MNDSGTDALKAILDEAVAGTDADFGNMHLAVNGSDGLTVVAEYGVAAMGSRNTTTCDRAMSNRMQVVMDDIGSNAEAGYRSVQSTPLIGRTGAVLGVISTHYRQPGQASGKRLRIISLYARLSAALVEWMRVRRDLNGSYPREMVVEFHGLVAQLRSNRDNESRLRALCERAELLLSQLVEQSERLRA